jgi:hypothetical protein
MPTATLEQKPKTQKATGAVYCPLCTHTVPATVIYGPRGARVTPGQKCQRCSSSLDAGYVIRVDRAA